MTTKLPVTAGQYRIVKSRVLPSEGLRPEGLRPEGLRPEGLRPEVMRATIDAALAQVGMPPIALEAVAVSRSRLDERLAALVASGKVAAATVASKYHELVSKFSGGGS